MGRHFGRSHFCTIPCGAGLNLAYGAMDNQRCDEGILSNPLVNSCVCCFCCCGCGLRCVCSPISRVKCFLFVRPPSDRWGLHARACAHFSWERELPPPQPPAPAPRADRGVSVLLLTTERKRPHIM